MKPVLDAGISHVLLIFPGKSNIRVIGRWSVSPRFKKS